MYNRKQEPALDDYLTIKKAAAFLGVSPSTLRNWDKTRKLSSYRHPINRYRLYLKADLQVLLQNVKDRNQ